MFRRPDVRHWYWLLLLPYAALLWPPLYARHDPTLAGVPFFYWYQFVWIALSGLITGCVAWLTRAAGGR